MAGYRYSEEFKIAAVKQVVKKKENRISHLCQARRMNLNIPSKGSFEGY